MDTTKISPYLLPLIPLSLFFILWELFANAGIVNPALFSKPSVIFIKIIESSSELSYHILFTFYRLVISFFIALLMGTGLGMIMGYKKQIYQFFNPLITIENIKCVSIQNKRGIRHIIKNLSVFFFGFLQFFL